MRQGVELFSFLCFLRSSRVSSTTGGDDSARSQMFLQSYELDMSDADVQL